MKYVISFTYDVAHYADFVVEADDRKEALAKAKSALNGGRFENVLGQPDDAGKNQRVFVLRRANGSDDCCEPL